MPFSLITLLLAAGLFSGMLICAEIGRRTGMAAIRRYPDGLAKGIGSVEGAVFGLLGLIIAFTFSGAETRFEHRRHIITEEANAIGTAYRRIDLLPPDVQPEMRELFRRYLDSRLAVYRNADDTNVTMTHLARSAALQEEIWKRSVSAGSRPGVASHTSILMLSALNPMIDITTTRTTATRDHPPLVILLLFLFLSLISSMLVGYNMSVNENRRWLHTVAFALIFSIAVFVILELEFPRRGLVRVDDADQVLVELRQSMK
jgi:hypothetical protein